MQNEANINNIFNSRVPDEPRLADQNTDRLNLDLEKFARDLLKSSDAKDRATAARSLGEPEADACPATVALCSATLDRSSTVRRAALEVLEKVDFELHQPISTIILDNDIKKHTKARRRLSQIGEAATTAVDVRIFTLSSLESLGVSPARSKGDEEFDKNK